MGLSVRYGCVFPRKEFLSVMKGVYESQHGKKKPYVSEEKSDDDREAVFRDLIWKRNYGLKRKFEKAPEEQFLEDCGLDLETLALLIFTGKPTRPKDDKENDGETTEKETMRYLLAEDSVDSYTGDDDAEDVYVYLSNRGHSIGYKGGDFVVLDKEVFQVSDEDVEYLNKELARVGLLGKETERGWLFKSST